MLSFVAPIGAFLWRAVSDTAVAPVLPRTIAALAAWDGLAAPDEAAFAALVEDLRAARAHDQASGAGGIARAASRLNADRPGFRGLLPMTARRIEAPFEGAARTAVLAVSEDWADLETWGAIRRAGGPLTSLHVLTALDLRQDAAGRVQAVPPDQRLFRAVLLRSLSISLLVTLACLALGWPLAWLIATSRGWAATLLLGAVMLPFWISLVVRTAAWMVLLQRDGIVNSALAGLGFAPLPLMMNRFAVVLAMVHILLPFMVLALVFLTLFIDMLGIGLLIPVITPLLLKNPTLFAEGTTAETRSEHLFGATLRGEHDWAPASTKRPQKPCSNAWPRWRRARCAAPG
jgi:putative spermidine/putrescine transport system permease protein